jgi:hypothetical protein
LENIQKEKLQFKKEVIEVTTQDADWNDVVEMQEVLSLLWTSNVKLPNCDIEVDEKEIVKTNLKDLQDWNFMDYKNKIIKKEIKKQTKK